MQKNPVLLGPGCRRDFSRWQKPEPEFRRDKDTDDWEQKHPE